MSNTLHFRDVRLHDKSPASYRARSDSIGMTSEATLDSLEDRLRRSVGLRDVPTVRALPRSVARVYEMHRHTRSFGLVLDEGTELPERPARESSALLPSLSPHPRTYAFEVFKSNCPLRAFGKLDNLFADYMVRVAGKPLLSARKFFQPASRGVRAFLLELRPQAAVAVSNRGHRLRASGHCRPSQWRYS